MFALFYFFLKLFLQIFGFKDDTEKHELITGGELMNII